jgi:transcriptional regulator with XRE-family HTH domain
VQLGLSTREFGRLAGVSYPTISRIENGSLWRGWEMVRA